MFFKNSYEQIYNIEKKLDKLEKNIVYKSKNFNKEQIDNIINHFSSWFISKINKLLSENTDKDIFDYIMLDQRSLLDYLDENSLFQSLEENDVNKKFRYDYEFRRLVEYAAQYKIMSVLGKKTGSEYALLYNKIFNWDLSVPMKYAYYEEGVFSESYKRYVETYLKLGGNPNIYVLKDYYSNDINSKYCLEELPELIAHIRAWEARKLREENESKQMQSSDDQIKIIKVKK